MDIGYEDAAFVYTYEGMGTKTLGFAKSRLFEVTFSLSYFSLTPDEVRGDVERAWNVWLSDGVHLYEFPIVLHTGCLTFKPIMRVLGAKGVNVRSDWVTVSLDEVSTPFKFRMVVWLQNGSVHVKVYVLKREFYSITALSGSLDELDFSYGSESIFKPASFRPDRNHKVINLGIAEVLGFDPLFMPVGDTRTFDNERYMSDGESEVISLSDPKLRPYPDSRRDGSANDLLKGSEQDSSERNFKTIQMDSHSREEWSTYTGGFNEVHIDSPTPETTVPHDVVDLPRKRRGYSEVVMAIALAVILASSLTVGLVKLLN